jgi:hypothetical protein
LVSGNYNITITTIPTTKCDLYACPKQERGKETRHQNEVYMILVWFSSVCLTPQKTYCDITYLGPSNSITLLQKTGGRA